MVREAKMFQWGLYLKGHKVSSFIVHLQADGSIQKKIKTFFLHLHGRLWTQSEALTKPEEEW